MDLHSIGNKSEDRITMLPDSVIHYILSFLDIKCVFRTSLLSKRWNYLWTSIPILVFPDWNLFTSLPEINNFMDFVDRTLHLHDTSSNIQKFSLNTHKYMNPSQVHSWISSLTKHNVEELSLTLDLERPFFVPLSLFTCQSLIKLVLYANDTTHLPKSFSFPKLKSLKLCGIRFTDDSSWNEQQFSNCPVLEDLILDSCSWFGVRNFCISTPTLKFLKIDTNTYSFDTNTYADDGLRDCALKINTPSLMSLNYFGCVAKEYVFPSFQALESAEVLLCDFGVRREQQIGYGAAVSNFFRMLSHVQNLGIYPEALEALSIGNDFVNTLPVFHDLKHLILREGETTDKWLFLLLKASPNLKWLIFEESCIDDYKEEEHSWAGLMLTAGCIFQHLQSVTFVRSSGNKRQMRWVKLILKNAKALEEVVLCIRNDDAVNKEVLMSELLSLPKASERCEFELEEY